MERRIFYASALEIGGAVEGSLAGWRQNQNAGRGARRGVGFGVQSVRRGKRIRRQSSIQAAGEVMMTFLRMLS